MKILITGATGFIGSQLVLEARARGYEVVATGQLNNSIERSRAEQLKAAGVDVITGSLRDAAFTQMVARGCDVVVHLAAAQHEANVPDEYFHYVNVDGTRTLLEACVAAGATRFVFGSSIGVYGEASDSALSEESPTAPANAYGASKLAAEHVVRSYNDEIETVIARISETYGPGDYRLLKLFKAVERGVFVMIGSGTNVRQPIHVQDLARGLLLMAEHPAAAGETFLLAGPAPITTRDVITSIAAAVDRKVIHAQIPIAPVLFAAHVMERLCKPLSIQPPLHRRRLDFFRKSFWFTTSKAKALLGFEATIPFAAGVRDTASWYCRNGLLRGTTSKTGADVALEHPRARRA